MTLQLSIHFDYNLTGYGGHYFSARPVLKILINQLGGSFDFLLCLYKFFQIPYDYDNYEERRTHLSITTVKEVEELVDKCTKMICHFHQQCFDLNNLYTFIHKNRHSLGYLGLYPVANVCALARITHQPNYDVLRKNYLEECFKIPRKIEESEKKITQSFNQQVESARFATELVETKEDFLNLIARDFHEDRANQKALKEADIGNGPFFLIRDISNSSLTRLKYDLKRIPKGGKPIVLALAGIKEELISLITEHGGIVVSGRKFLYDEV